MVETTVNENQTETETPATTTKTEIPATEREITTAPTFTIRRYLKPIGDLDPEELDRVVDEALMDDDNGPGVPRFVSDRVECMLRHYEAKIREGKRTAERLEALQEMWDLAFVAGQLAQGGRDPEWGSCSEPGCGYQMTEATDNPAELVCERNCERDGGTPHRRPKPATVEISDWHEI
jgi:hypothetical protein